MGFNGPRRRLFCVNWVALIIVIGEPSAQRALIRNVHETSTAAHQPQKCRFSPLSGRGRRQAKLGGNPSIVPHRITSIAAPRSHSTIEVVRSVDPKGSLKRRVALGYRI